MTKKDIHQVPSYFNRYIDKAPDLPFIEVLEFTSGKYLNFESEKLIALGDKTYAPGKWNVKQIIQHLIDTERVFQYRAMRFARRDGVSLPGFDENLFADNAVVKKDVVLLIEEFDVIRKSGIMMFESFTQEDLLSVGIAAENEISVISLSYILAGHIVHHMDILKERYYPLI